MALGWLWWRAWFPVDDDVAAAVGVAGVALGDMDLHFAWQAWHLATSTFTLRGRRGTYGTGWLWWRAWFPVDAVVAAAVGVAGVALGCTWRHRPPLCAAGVALMALRWLWWRG